MRRGFTLVEFLVLVVVIGILAALLVPAFVRMQRNSKIAHCANNLQALWTALEQYRTEMGGPDRAYPSESGSALWLRLSRTQPPLARDPSVYDCPLRPGAPEAGAADYRGPKHDLNGKETPYKEDDAIGSDLDGNHGEGEGGNVLFKSGAVRVAGPRDPFWKEASVRTAP